MPNEGARPKAPVLTGFALVILVFLLYAPSVVGGFMWDDDVYLTENSLIRTSGGLLKFWFSTEPIDYYPLSNSSLWLQWRVWGGDPFGYRLINLLLHAAATLLTWRVLLRLKVPGAVWGALFFGLHPVNVQAVAWISQHKGVLALALGLASLLFWLRYEDKPSRLRYVMALGLFTLALLAKTSVVMLPVVMLLLTRWRNGSLCRRDLRRLAPYFAVALVLALATMWFQANRSIGDTVVRTDDLLSRVAGSGRALSHYLRTVLVPVPLAVVYPRWGTLAGGLIDFLPLAVAVSAGVLLWRGRRPALRAAFLAFAAYCAMLLPFLGMVNIGFMKFSLVADHWQYASLGALTALTGAGLARLRRVGFVASALVVGALGFLGFQRAVLFGNEVALWEDNARVYPAEPQPHFRLGTLLMRNGEEARAERHLRAAVALDPDSPKGHNNLGLVLSRTGRNEEALRCFEEVCELQPDHPSSWHNVAAMHAALGRSTEAERHYRTALARDPDYASALHGLSWLLATAPSDELRDGEEAERLAERAIEIVGRPLPDFLELLAAAYAEQGRFEEAVRVATDARRLARELGSPTGELEKQLQAYAEGRPWRTTRGE